MMSDISDIRLRNCIQKNKKCLIFSNDIYPQNGGMFKRSLSPEAFDQFSFNKKETSPSTAFKPSEDVSISDLSTWETYKKLVVAYERPIHWSLSVLIGLLLILTHWHYQDDVDMQLNSLKRQLLSHQTEISAIKKESTKNQMVLASDSELVNPSDLPSSSDELIADINYLGAFQQGVTRRGLISYGSPSEDQPQPMAVVKTQWVSVGQTIELVGTVKTIEDGHLVIESSSGRLVTIWARRGR
jgi:hypothetical protein